MGFLGRAALLVPVFLILAPSLAQAQIQNGWRLIYLRGTRAPKPLVLGVQGELKEAIRQTGTDIVDSPTDSEDERARAAIADARTALDAGVKSFTQLDLDQAMASLVQAEVKARAEAIHPEAVPVLFDALLHQSRILLASDSAADAADKLTQAAVLGPDKADARKFPPEIVAGYGHAREQLMGGGTGRLRIAVTPPKARVYVDGRLAKPTVTLPAGTHYVSARAPGYQPGGMAVNIAANTPAKIDLFLTASDAEAVDALRKAWRAGNPAAAAAAAARVREASGAIGVLAWDLRSNKGKVEALLVPIEVDMASAPAPVHVALPAGATGARVELRAAFERILSPPIDTRVGTRKRSRKVWYWTAAAVGVAVLAGGTVAIAARQGPGQGDELNIIIER